MLGKAGLRMGADAYEERGVSKLRSVVSSATRSSGLTPLRPAWMNLRAELVDGGRELSALVGCERERLVHRHRAVAKVGLGRGKHQVGPFTRQVGEREQRLHPGDPAAGDKHLGLRLFGAHDEAPRNLVQAAPRRASSVHDVRLCS